MPTDAGLAAMHRRRFLSVSATSLAGLIAGPRWLFGGGPPDGCARAAAIATRWSTTVKPMLASRYHRLHHCLFHYVRNNWAGLSDAQRHQLTDLQWNVPRPSMEFAAWEQSKPWRHLNWAIGNSSGEDFLYYHRWMIEMVDAELAKFDLGPIEPWSGADAVPAPRGGCADEAVPDFTPVFANPADPAKPINVPSLQVRVRELKSPSFFWDKLNWWQQEFTDPVFLRTLTLGELGAKIEGGIHNQMHIRWSAYPSNGRRQIRDEPDFRTQWDDPGYDTLFDEYSSHVPPNFYRLHKWVDNRIEDWAEAHGKDVKRVRTPLGFDWFELGDWVKTSDHWTGRWGFEHVDAAEQKQRIAVMEQVVKILYPDAAAAAAPLARKRRPHPEHEILTIRDLVM